MIADYFFLRGTRLDTESLYRREGAYEYRKGVNPRALIALAAGVCCGADRALVCRSLRGSIELCVVCGLRRGGGGVCGPDGHGAAEPVGRLRWRSGLR